jgi:hypothetical protein
VGNIRSDESIGSDAAFGPSHHSAFLIPSVTDSLGTPQHDDFIAMFFWTGIKLLTLDDQGSLIEMLQGSAMIVIRWWRLW